MGDARDEVAGLGNRILRDVARHVDASRRLVKNDLFSAEGSEARKFRQGDDPRVQALKQYLRILFGEDQRFGKPAMGSKPWLDLFDKATKLACAISDSMHNTHYKQVELAMRVLTSGGGGDTGAVASLTDAELRKRIEARYPGMEKATVDRMLECARSRTLDIGRANEDQNL